MDLSVSEHSHSHTPIIFPELSFSWFNSTFYVHHVAEKKPVESQFKEMNVAGFFLLLAATYRAVS